MFLVSVTQEENLCASTRGPCKGILVTRLESLHVRSSKTLESDGGLELSGLVVMNYVHTG